MRQAYIHYLENAFSDPTIWDRHRKELLDLVSYARSNGAKTMFILFPNLADIEGSSKVTAQIGRFLRKQGVKFVDLGLKLTGRRSENLMVSSFDTHPNVLLHEDVAEILYVRLKEVER